MREKIVTAVDPIGSQPPRYPRRAPAPTGDHDLDDRPRVPRPLTPAAVLVPLVERRGGLQVLLTQRTDHLYDHAGQISFPGGRADPGDPGPVETALRETREEIGLRDRFIDIVGFLDDYETGTGFRVTPVVGFVAEGFRLSLDEFEVAEVFEVPLEFILDRTNHRTATHTRRGVRRNYYVFEYRDRYIWGATAGMLMNLYRRLAGETLAELR